MSPDGLTIDFSSTNGGVGSIALRESLPNFVLEDRLLGQFKDLSMTVVDPALGLFDGSGNFRVTGGSLAADFGDNGGLVTIGLTFQVPANFNSGFIAVASTRLFPQVPNSGIPEPASLLTWIGLALAGAVGYRRRALRPKMGNC